KQKPAEAGFYVNQVKLTDKAASFNHTSGICGAGVVLCRRLYRSLYHNDSPEIYLLSLVSKVLV
ncbi:hypothetical protein U4U13_10855, partial [Escherichia coli]|nr:hypothetical protein [Escherichia coli]